MILNKIPLIQFSDYKALSRASADLILDRIKKKRTLSLGLATGFSPRLTYFYLGENLSRDQKLRSWLRVVQLDEWFGAQPEDPSSCQHYLKKHVIESWGLKDDQCILLNGNSRFASAEIQKFQKHLADNPLDLCILGLGKNGHLALNEPGSVISQSSRIVVLQPQSREHDMLRHRQVPITKGMTIGLDEIMSSGEIILLVAGPGKEEAFDKLILEPPSDEFPASVLFEHPNWHCFVDKSAIKAVL